MPRAKRLHLDTNLISVDGLKTILEVINAEKEATTEKTSKMKLLVDSAFLEVVIKERESKK